MKQQAILTIAIPTWNRAKELDQRLKEIASQYDERLVVLISDNASDDETQSIMAQYLSCMPYVRYHRNQTNLGFDRNILALYMLANTKYVWFLGDDDRIEEMAIQAVLDKLEQYAPVVAIGNSATWLYSGERMVSGSECEVMFARLEDVKDYSIFTRAIFLSGLIVQKNPLTSPAELEPYVGTGFIHLTLALLLLSLDFRLVFLPLVLVERKAGYFSNHLLLYRFFVGCYHAVDLPGRGYDLNKFKAVFLKSATECFRILMASKIGVFQVENPIQMGTLRQIYKIYGVRSIYLGLLLIGYYVTPRWVLKLYFWWKQICVFGIM